MNHRSPLAASTCRLAIAVRGVVQGVGFRPFVYNAARSRGLAGWVRNEADVVRIEVEGDRAAVDAFLGDLRDRHPPQARIDAIDVEELSPLLPGEGPGVRAADLSENAKCKLQNANCILATSNPQSLIPNPPSASPHPSPHPSPLPKGEGTVLFEIRASEGQSPPQPTIPADLATCPECLAEIRDPSQRRYNYPFTNCTNCGPRWSIIQRLPYDRPRTSMASFEMCPECRAEYDNPADRRFHAQPIACPRCGPSLELLDRDGRQTAAGQAALDSAAQLLLAGKIVAMKGLGGFQLLADATSVAAVALLRRRKRRPDRPFAVMAATLDEARQYCEISEEEAESLSSHRAPIVLLRRKLTDVCHCLSASSADTAQDRGTACEQAVAHTSSPPLSPLLSPLSPLPSPLCVVPGVAPGNPYLGVMLPYTPLHHLLLAAVGRPLVCTSGNLSDEPMAIAVEDARRRLGPIADAILTHNRPIVRPVDDSIVRLGPDGPQVLRRARGFAPLPIELHSCRTGCQLVPRDAPTILAVGGHLKNTVALALGRVRACTHAAGWSAAVPAASGGQDARAPGCPVRASTHPTQVVLSAHVGDLDNVPSVDVFRRAIDDLLDFFQAAPDAVVCDLHPDYASTRHAERLSAEWGVPLVRVQHHHAHVAACMAEHGLQGPALGFSWDGAGYGPDGTVWGGEVLWCDGAKFRRIAHLRTFALPGGEAAARQPRRSALGLLVEMLGPRAADHAAEWFAPGELKTLLSMLDQGVNSPRASSMGRLFDAVAALCGLPPVTSFEGQAAMSLEYAAAESEQESYEMALSSCGAGVSPALVQARRLHHNTVGQVANLSYDGAVLDWEPLVRGVLADRAAGVPVARISARFHNALANMAATVAQALVGQVANLSSKTPALGRQLHCRPNDPAASLAGGDSATIAPTESATVAPAKLPIVLSGGCFQNALLTARVRSRLLAAGFPVYTHRDVPPGDGGIALGQAFIALKQLH
jgi:hydrogenase maturation protein HypF